jgi:arylsulfatase A-like enzyme
MVVWGQKFSAAGKISREPVISMDVMATALAAAGVSMPAGYTLDGRSLLPVLRGQQKQPLHQNLFWAGQLAQNWVHPGAGDEMTAPPAWAVRKGRWMLRYWSHLERHELYDLENDRGERVDVLSKHPQIVRELKADYAQWFKGTKKPMAWEEQYWKLLAPRA